jgi:hypothetical protein
MPLIHVHPLLLLAATLAGAAAMIAWRYRESSEPVTLRKIVAPPLGMSTGPRTHLAPGAECSQAARCASWSGRSWADAAHGAARRRSWAFTATITVLSDISTAPAAGARTIPQRARTPAASGIAATLYPAAHHRFWIILR